jgi:hypothetical protein
MIGWQFFITLQFDVTPNTWLDAGDLHDLLPPFPKKWDPQYFLRLFKISQLQNMDIQ